MKYGSQSLCALHRGNLTTLTSIKYPRSQVEQSREVKINLLSASEVTKVSNSKVWPSDKKKMDAIEIDLEEAYQKGISDVVIETFFKKYPSARFYRFKSI